MQKEYVVRRVDGGDIEPGSKLFVLDTGHDDAAVVAMLAYADFIEENEPDFAENVRRTVLGG